MSSARGSDKRKRPQRYQNSTVYKNDKWDKGDLLKKLNTMNVNEVCVKCRDVIQWKIKYNKYKPLTKPKTCNVCHQKTITKAYHVLCRSCALEKKQCAKCLNSDEVNPIVPHVPTQQERIKMDIEMRQMVKSLSERKRRTFLRYLNGKKRKSKKNEDGEEEEEDEEEKAIRIAPKSRDDLMKKLTELKIGKEDEEFYDGVIDSEDDDDDDYEDYSSSDEDGSGN